MTPTKESPTNQQKASAVSEELCGCFSLSEIKLATNNQASVISRGGFGTAYRGFIDDGVDGSCGQTDHELDRVKNRA